MLVHEFQRHGSHLRQFRPVATHVEGGVVPVARVRCSMRRHWGCLLGLSTGRLSLGSQLLHRVYDINSYRCFRDIRGSLGQ